MGIVIVEVCDVNPASGLELESLEIKYPGTSVIRTPCLSNCSQCAQHPYAYVNGEIYWADTTDQLWNKLQAAIEQELASFE
ncbi:DUF1450 domain-containing protein [Tumebacillus lipolyticus]|uniref:DUF1450 domain-containing protein n=1 Tax=Tumebacillus lipolyticus TaxID=1280370 RepID=A0ABW4ZS58_9BACL